MKKLGDIIQGLSINVWLIIVVILAVISYLVVTFLENHYPKNTEYPVYYGIGLMIVLILLIFNPFQYLKK